MVEVVYFELGTEELQVVPRASLSPITNYEQVERLRTWGLASVSFKLIDVGGNKNFMSMPLSQKLETSNRHLAILHWDDNIPAHLKRDLSFWVGPIDTYDWRDKSKPRYFNEAEPPRPSNKFQRVEAQNARLQAALTGALPDPDTLMPRLDFGSDIQQRLEDLRITPLQSESSTVPQRFETSTPFRQPGPLTPPPDFGPSDILQQRLEDLRITPLQSESSTVPQLLPAFEYKPPTARKRLGSSTAPGKSGSSTLHMKPGSPSAEKVYGPPAAPTTRRKADSSKIHKPSSPRTPPQNNNLSKALKQPGSRRYIAEPEPLNVFRQADRPDPLMPPFDHDPSTPPNQTSPSSPFWRSTSSTLYQTSGPATTGPGRNKSGSSIAHHQSRICTPPPNQYDSPNALEEAGSWKRRLSHSGLVAGAGRAGSSSTHTAARARAAPAQSGLWTAPVEEEGEGEAYRSWWSDDGHDNAGKGRGLK